MYLTGTFHYLTGTIATCQVNNCQIFDLPVRLTIYLSGTKVNLSGTKVNLSGTKMIYLSGTTPACHVNQLTCQVSRYTCQLTPIYLSGTCFYLSLDLRSTSNPKSTNTDYVSPPRGQQAATHQQLEHSNTTACQWAIRQT